MADCSSHFLVLLKWTGSDWLSIGIGEIDEWDVRTKISEIQLRCELDMLDKEEEIRNQEKVPCNKSKEDSNQGNWLVMCNLPDVGITAQLCIEEPSYPTHGLCGTCSGAVWSAQGLNRAKLLRATNSQPANMRATWIMGWLVGEVRSGGTPSTQ